MLPMNSLALSEHVSEEQEIQATVKQLAQQVAEAESNYETLTSSMEATVNALEESFPAYASLYRDTALAVNRLHEQVEEVARQREAEERARREERRRKMFGDEEESHAGDEEDADDDDLYEDDEAERPRFGWSDRMEQRTSARNNVRQQGTLKQLFKRLARLGHPDKTEDPVLRKLFERGREALDEGAKDLMADLLLDAELHIAGNDVDAGKKIPDLMERLMERQRYLNRQLYQWNVRTNSLRQTPMGQVHTLSTNDSPTVREQGKTVFKTQLLKRMEELENTAVRLRQQLISAGVTPEA